MTYTILYPSVIGQLTVASDGQSITGLWMEGQKNFGSTLSEPILDGNNIPVLQAAQEWLDHYFSGVKPRCPEELPLRLIGTPFQQEVWGVLLQIPYGHLMTYGDIARRIAKLHGRESMSSQAVGNAVGKNPISILLPCHRVVGKKGKLTGFAGGTERKLALLQLEGISSDILMIS